MSTDRNRQILLAASPRGEPSPNDFRLAEYVVTEVRGRGVPLAVVLSGGYGPASWEAHARSIEGVLARFDCPT